MKKQLALWLALVLLVSVLAGCSGKGSDTGIPAAAFSTQSVLTLPLKAELNSGDYLTYGGHQFISKKSLSKMADLIVKNNENVTAAEFKNAYGSCWLFSREVTGGVDSWCLYQQDPANIKNSYIFSGMHRELTTQDGAMELLLPLHLISDSYIRDNMGNRLSLDHAYACGVQDQESTVQQLFETFYQNSGFYTLSPLDDGFALTPKQGLRLQLKIGFTQQDGSDYFTISDITERAPVPSENVTVRWVMSEDIEAQTASPDSADALQMSGLLIGATYADGAAAVDYPYSIDVDGETYNARLLWNDTDATWSGTVYRNGKTAALSTSEASELAALMYQIGFYMPDESVAEADPENVTPMSACMATTTEVNVRLAPNTSGTIEKTLEKDAPVAVVGKLDGWYQILFGGHTAYMSADYLRAA